MSNNGANNVLAIQRRSEIQKIILEEKVVTVANLSHRFGVTYETIRRDLDLLVRQGYAKKVYGGAALNERVQNKVNFNTLANMFSENKKEIARKARQFIYVGDCIFLDSSTTAYHIISEIADMNLTVMSNSLKTLSQLAEHPSITVSAIGGTLDRLSSSFLGSGACTQLASFHLDKAFISCSALDMEGGLSDKYEENGTLHRTVIENSNEVYLIVDHTKFNKITYSKFADFKRITAIITDTPLSKEWMDFLDERNIAYY